MDRKMPLPHKRIRKLTDKLFRQAEEIRTEITKVQLECQHVTSVYEAGGSTGNWDREDSYWYVFYCYDCRKRWSHDQDKGRPGNALKVDKIDYTASAEVIEFKRGIAQLKGRS
jgi:hypothetical protein